MQEEALRGAKELGRLRAALVTYHPFWLRLGVEVAVGRPAEGELTPFLERHLLRDPDLLLRHAGVRTPAYWQQLGRLVLKRLLLLVALLDHAAEGAAGPPPARAPLLFRPGGRLRASSGAALQETAGALLGEAEVGRHLGRLGYRVTHEQHPRAELDFFTRNLAVDLRNGLRLCRLAEALAPAPGLLAAARQPAARRPDRLHNVGLALGALRGAGLSLDGVRTARGPAPLAAAEVADGERQGTVCLLWRLVLRFQLPRLVAPAQLRMEVDRLRQEDAGGRAEVEGEAWQRSRPRPPAAALGEELAADAGASGDHVAALLEWVQAAVGRHGAEAADFGAAFADGSVLCLLVSCRRPLRPRTRRATRLGRWSFAVQPPL